ncbi:hypothetical protein G7067_00085 [Leucobacter insecticola]|uniref:Uncharacterized protein n=1 Tax=Leucobacter insecticola TaxID=2714934 RepID=A0A6G8FFH9_9MICO|nr:hypothetical protein [Leucobacter insecticola]QIM15176.1 hypothetical protein G7067_00085 [Leucobacter insecticola]
MTQTRGRSRIVRTVLIVVMVLAIAVLGLVVAILVPILTHQSAGGSGQQIASEPTAEVSATGADGRERTLRVENGNGALANVASLEAGEELVVQGTGFDSQMGIYVAICAIPESPDEKPGPCLGGVPSGAKDGGAAGEEGLASVWITDDWAWRAFATHGYADSEKGTFTARITVPDPVGDELDCRTTRCAVTTRSDHTAASDRVQDLIAPVEFQE